MLSKTKNFISRRNLQNVRRTEKTDTRTTPLGASADTKSLQRTESTDTAAHSRGRDPRKGLSLGEERRGSERFGGTVMFYRAESGITNKSVSGDRGAYGFLSVLSRRAHLLTTDKVGGVPLRGCALYEVMRRRGAPIFLQSLHKKGSDRLSPYTILKQKSSPVVQVAPP